MSDRLSLMGWGKDDSCGGIWHRLGTFLLKQALRVLPVESFKSYHWYPSGYSSEKYRAVISSRRVDYHRDHDHEEGHPIWLVKHDEDGVLGAFFWWKGARKAASLLSQHFEDYHFREDVLNEETERVVHAEDAIDELEPNLEVEEVFAHRKLDWDEWDESDRLITGETVRTLDDVKEQIDVKNDDNRYVDMEADRDV